MTYDPAQNVILTFSGQIASGYGAALLDQTWA
jgi:hypothetical protein